MGGVSCVLLFLWCVGQKVAETSAGYLPNQAGARDREGYVGLALFLFERWRPVAVGES